ncbi:MAG: hypothetical protein P8J87_14695, partial [Verrucomicrobiales bacterium]|nr:hypothetical protein [Verrucomicrobiales bacterium]
LIHHTLTATLLATLFGAGTTHAQNNIGNTVLDNRNDTRIEIVSVFGDVPTHGYAPVRVSIKNGTTTDRTWTFSFSINSNTNHSYAPDLFTSTFRLSADKQSQAVHDVLVPIPTLFTSGYSYGGPRLNVDISGGGYGSERHYLDSNTTGDSPITVLSSGIANKNLSLLNDEARKRTSSSGGSNFGSSFDPAMLPNNWLGYTGVDVLLITDDEWIDVNPGVRTAVTDWVRLGGALHIYSTKPNLDLEDLGLPSAPGKRSDKLTLGTAEIYQWDGKDLDIKATYNSYQQRYKKDILNAKRQSLSKDFISNWGLQNALGGRKFASWQVAVILVIFGILVGPVNLFVFAKAGQRHRLFFTTPIISIGTSLLLIVLIFLQDGTGGEGRRLALVAIDETARKAYQIQEQVSRTGVLFGNDFATDEPAFISAVPMGKSQWASLSGTRNRGDHSYSLIDQTTFAGDWFKSRSEQSQYIETITATRARIERLPGDDTTPTLVSGLDVTIETLYYIDDAGEVWRSTAAVPVGQKAQLQASDTATFESELKKLTDLASAKLGSRISDLQSKHGSFFAITNASNPLVPTLSSVAWNDDITIIHGQVTTPE